MHVVEFYYDFSCPYAYLGHTQIERVALKHGAAVVWKPMLLGGVFRAIRPDGATEVPATEVAEPKRAMNAVDLKRWAARWRAPLVFPPTHPNRTVLALRATLASGNIAKASKALFQAYWVQGNDVSDPAVVAAALSGAGFDGAALVRRADEQAIKDDLRKRTDEAIAAGVFGAPTFVVGKDLYWGQDRLLFVDEALARLTGERHAVAADSTRVSAGPRREFQYFFDFSSPFAYLASTQIAILALRTNARPVYRPFLLGGLFKAIGTPDVPMMRMPEAKRRHSGLDLDRWAAHYGVPFKFPSRFPMNTVRALRMVLATDENARPALVNAIYKAYWADDRDISNEAELTAIANDAGADGPALVGAASSDAMRGALREATDAAVKLGICGAPTFQVGDELFWGQDRIDFVEHALASGA